MKTNSKKRMIIYLIIITVLISSSVSFAQKFDKLALTPPMGWNSWNKFACNINEKLIRETADAMITSGLKDAGYIYINIDDCWHGKRDSLGFIHADPEKFPSGMKALADYIHSKGLKIGIYSDAGNKTCGGRPASRGHEYQDAITYASWGIDYLKYDWCDTDGLNPVGAYTTMRDALFSAGRPIVFSMCEWGNSKPWSWAKDVGHLWRTTGDISACWDGKIDHGTWASWCVMKILDMQDGLRQYASPGHWNDPDMMEVGNGMPVNEDRAHFSMWCMLAAPLIAGNDIANMSKNTKEILENKDVIAINQDSLGIQGMKYSAKDSVETWFKPLSKGDWAMCVLNRSKAPINFTFDWANEKVVDTIFEKETKFDSIEYSVKDLWTKNNLGTTKKMLNAVVPSHDVLMVRLIKK